MSLDPNLITAQWSVVTAFGVAISLLVPKAEEYRNTYLKSTDDYDRMKANQWVTLVQRAPIVVLAVVCGLSALGAANAGLGRTAKSPEQLLLIIVPIIAQLGFCYIIARLVPSIKPPVAAILQELPDKLPASSSSATSTKLVVSNDSAQMLNLWWINRNGSLDSLTKDGAPRGMSPGEELSLSTFVRNYFLVRTENGIPVGIIETKDGPTQAKVAQPDVDKALKKLRGTNTSLLPLAYPLPASPAPSSPTMVRIINESDTALVIWWIDRSGSLKALTSDGEPRVISPRNQHERRSNYGDRWLLQTKDGVDVGILEAKDGPTWTEVIQEQIDTARATSK